MHIEVIFENPDKHPRPIKLVALDGNERVIVNNTTQLVPAGWHQLRVPYKGTGRDLITDIKLNGESIEHLIYVGQYESNGEIHCPCTELWQEGEFTIWLHTNLGVLIKEYMEQIDNGHYGQNIPSLYNHTVDRPIELDNRFSTSVREFFAWGHGPRWWNIENNKELPYIRLPKYLFSKVDISELINTCKQGQDIVYKINSKLKIWAPKPFAEGTGASFNEFPYKPLAEALESVGYTQWINWGIQELGPGDALTLHRDDHYSREAAKHLSGCRKFYWGLDNINGTYFKLGSAGLLPIQDPLIINTSEFCHTVVNTSNQTRTIFLMYGEIDTDLIPGLHQQDK